MKYKCTTIYLLVIVCFNFLLISQPAVSNKVGKVTGGIPHEMPDWFKNSFLELAEDVAEANEEDKHITLFLHLNNCPYCAKMAEDFNANKEFIMHYFDTIAINIRGDREVAINESQTLTERELADMLGVKYTPTILFLDTNNTIVARANGYRTPQRMQMMFDFVRNKKYNTMSFVEYAQHLQSNTSYTFINNSTFKNLIDLSSVSGLLAVIFEDNSCIACAYFHTTTLTHPAVQEELKKYTVVRLDAKADTMITTPSGEQMSIKEFAKHLNLTYRPGVILFDEHREIQRIDGFLYTHHFATVLRYIANGNYKGMNFSDYLRFRSDELTSQGIDINLTQ